MRMLATRVFIAQRTNRVEAPESVLHKKNRATNAQRLSVWSVTVSTVGQQMRGQAPHRHAASAAGAG